MKNNQATLAVISDIKLLAKKNGVSVYRIRKEFKDITGHNIELYRRNRRLSIDSIAVVAKIIGVPLKKLVESIE